MPLELVSIETDTVPLDGLMYTPAHRPVRGAVQLFHGNAMNFYVGPPRFLPPRLVEAGFACLAYNRRGHDTLSTRNSRLSEGNAYQTAEQAVADNDYAAAWLGNRGFPPPVIIGHSNGGMLAVRHVADHPETPALVLLSAHRGGTRLVEIASRVGLLAGDRLSEITERAEELVAAGRGHELLLLPGWWWVTSASSFIDLLRNTPDILDLAPSITCPTLYLRGDLEPPALYPIEDFRERAKGRCDTAVIAQSDHFYNGAELRVADMVTNWLESVLL